jgi:hypothetical protein
LEQYQMKSRAQWLMPVILATQKVESGGLCIVRGQPGQNLHKTPSRPTSWAWWCMLVDPATQSWR